MMVTGAAIPLTPRNAPHTARVELADGYLQKFGSDWERNVAMPDIPIHNETEYSLTGAMLDQIKRDALEYFGESVRAIRVQYGIERHAFNARTGEMRYAFSPSDFGLIDTTASGPDTYLNRGVPSIDDDAEEEIDETAFDEIDITEEDEGETPLESLAEELDEVEDEEETAFPDLNDEFEDIAEEDKDFLYDDEYD
jgi:hypothetical protein